MENTNTTTIALPSLRDKAVTVTLKMSMYRPTRVDRRKTSDIQAQEGTGKFRVLKTILSDCSELKKVRSAYNALYSYVQANTLPWMDDGARLLPNESYMDFAMEVGDLRRKADDAINDLCNNWQSVVQSDMQSFGSAADPSDYPTVDELRKKFCIRVRFTPISDASDFRLDVSDEDRMALDEELDDVRKQATDYLLGELMAPIKKMVETLSMPEGQRGKHWFESSLLGNVRDVCNRAERLNINHDQRVTDVCNQAREILAGLSASELKECKGVAEDVRDAMSDVQKKLNSWF